MRVHVVIAATALLAACGAKEHPAQNQAATPAASTAPLHTSSISTASDARAIMERAGFAEVANFGRDAAGHWTATATLNGAAVNVMIDDAGVATIYEPAATN